MSTTHLRPVGDDEAPQLRTVTTPSGLPDFEGQPVDSTLMRLAAVSKLEVGDDANRIDDVVRMYVEGRVVRVDHAVDEKTGLLQRIHTVKVVDALQLPWNFDAGQLGG